MKINIKLLLLVMSVFGTLTGCSSPMKKCEIPDIEYEYSMARFDNPRELELVTTEINWDITGTWEWMDSPGLDFIVFFSSGAFYTASQTTDGLEHQMGKYSTKGDKVTLQTLLKDSTATNQNQYFIIEKIYKVIEEDGIHKLFMTDSDGTVYEYHQLVVIVPEQ